MEKTSEVKEEKFTDDINVEDDRIMDANQEDTESQKKKKKKKKKKKGCSLKTHDYAISDIIYLYLQLITPFSLITPFISLYSTACFNVKR